MIRLVADSGSLSGSAPNGLKLSGDYKVAESDSELAGRTTALLGLRDAVFRTCEAASNGYIGHLGYVLVLNRYGQALVTLFLAQDAQAAAFAAHAAAEEKQPDTPPTADKNTPGAPQKAPAPAPQAAPAANTVFTPDIAPELHGLFRNVVDVIPAVAAAHPVAKKPVVAPKKTPPIKSVPPAETPTGDLGAAAELEQMQQNYLRLTSDPREMVHLAFIACLEEYDPTRVVPSDAEGKPAYNALLTTNCPDFVRTVFQNLGKASSSPVSPPQAGYGK